MSDPTQHFHSIVTTYRRRWWGKKEYYLRCLDLNCMYRRGPLAWPGIDAPPYERDQRRFSETPLEEA